MTRRVEEDAKTIAELTLKAKRPRSRAAGTQTASGAGVGVETEEEDRAKLRDPSRREGLRGRRHNWAQRSKPRRGASSIDAEAEQNMMKLQGSDSKKDDNAKSFNSTFGNIRESKIDIIQEEPLQNQARELTLAPETTISRESSKHERD